MLLLENYITSSASVSPQDLQIILSHFKSESLSKGEFYGRKNLYCQKLGFLEQGYFRFFIEVEEREVTQWVSGPNYFITDLSSFIFQSPGRWNMQALTDCEVQTLTHDSHEKLCKVLPAWKELYYQLIAKCFAFMEDRTFRQIYMSSEKRFEYLMNTQPELFNFVPLQYLASMMGMTPETLSRLRKKSVQGQ